MKILTRRFHPLMGLHVALLVMLMGVPEIQAMVWDESCQVAINSLQGTQREILLARGALVAHDMSLATVILDSNGEGNSRRLGESEYKRKEEEFYSQINLFHVRLKEFSQNCLGRVDENR